MDFYNQTGDLVCSADSWCFRTDRDLAREQGTKYTAVKARPAKRYTDEELADVIARGKNKMPAYGKTLKPDEIKAMVAYIRSLVK